MNSLVCYGVSSDSDSDSDVSKCRQEREREHGKIEMAPKTTTKERNFLVESGGSASSDSEDGEEEAKSDDDSLAKPLTPIMQHITKVPPTDASTAKASKLPPPPLGGGGLVGSSVFANPFKERADERLNVLQKHVPLTLQARPTEIGGKKMCIAYRKDGRCRFGSRCKYAHDSDLQSTAALACMGTAEEDGTEAGSDTTCLTQAAPPPPQTPDSQTTTSFLRRGQEEDGTEEERARKKRPGLSNTLIPPKKALKQFNMQRQKDRYTPF